MDEHNSLDNNPGSAYHFESERYRRILTWLPRTLTLNLHHPCKQALALLASTETGFLSRFGRWDNDQRERTAFVLTHGPPKSWLLLSGSVTVNDSTYLLRYRLAWLERDRI
jgi:hypothetical protein